ncbi:class E sortase [Streptomyces sp. NPDC057910]|uniref:class E sortase n=1 Tax=Streptomyces sp. NPDC057910 TaxID=3346278 RepID=UPI0036E1B1AB
MTPELRPVTLSGPDPGRRASYTIGCFGEVLITVAVLAGLFLVYQLWWTNITAGKEAASTAAAIRTGWAADAPAGKKTDLPGIGFLHVPAMGRTGEMAVVEDTDTQRLNEGVVGYYTHPVRSAMPWDAEGNFSLAAHRDGHGAKFHNLDRVKNGDHIVMETKDKWYIYTVFATIPETGSDDVGVLKSIPEGSGRHTPGRYITLTTCTPALTSEYRLVVFGELTRIDAVGEGRTPPPEAESVNH